MSVTDSNKIHIKISMDARFACQVAIVEQIKYLRQCLSECYEAEKKLKQLGNDAFDQEKKNFWQMQREFWSTRLDSATSALKELNDGVPA